MFALKKGEIIPNIGIGSLRLGATEQDLFDLAFDQPLQMASSNFSTVYTGADVMVWVDKCSGQISQILVFGDFGGKMMGKFGVGTYLHEIERAFGERVRLEYEITMEYRFPSLPGVSFELEDLDIPDEVLLQKPYEALAPIGAITVFKDSL